MDGGVMLLWLRYLKQLEMACASTPEPPPDGAESIKIKSEDEEWRESEVMPEQPSTPSSGGERASTSPASPASLASPAASPASPAASPPRLRLNTRLATDPARAPLAAALAMEPPAAMKREPVSPSPPAAPPYTCAPCGIRYSSLSTLTAHREHYCSARRAAPPASPPDDAPAAGKQYACAHCSYSADKKVSLNRHMRMHAASPPAAPPANGDVDAPPPPDRYCADCDIRFSSVKTFRAHKTHYCSTRQVVKPAPARGGSSGGSAPASPRATPPAPLALALATDPILVVPYALLRSASALPGAALPHPDAPCFLLPDGSFRPLGRALPGDRDPDVLKAVNRPRDAVAPLDLSVRREAARPDDQEKENRAASPEHIVCAPELPPSPATPSPRRSPEPLAPTPPKRRRRESSATPGPDAPRAERSPPAPAPRLPVELPPAAASPQVLVKQGSAKCKECNIVFCKYENYRIHKRHYCAAGGDERASPAPEPGPPQYRQLICLACGIHFSSLDNLATHQAIYCTKRSAAAAAPGAGVAAGAWRCPCCDAVAASAAAAQRHLEAHAGLRAFRCTICRYRGNTLRGMRTHIRMHFPKKPQDLQEESYISCVMEDDSRESTSPSSGSGNGSERIHRCRSCAYSSTYRGNVVRHARIVHGADEPDVEETPTTPTPKPPTPTPVQIKKEEPDTEPEETPNYCKSCDISFKYVNTYKAHKQFYCTANNPDAAANNNVTPVVRVTDTPVL